MTKTSKAKTLGIIMETASLACAFISISWPDRVFFFILAILFYCASIGFILKK